MLRELVSADVLEGAPLEGRDDEAAASGRGARACDSPRHGPPIPPLVARATPVAPGAETAARGEAPGGGGDVVDVILL